MLVKCRDLNDELRDRNYSYRGKDKRYYSSKEAYDRIQKEDEWRFKCYDSMAIITGYDKRDKLPPYMLKRLKEIGENWGYEALYNTIKQQSQTIDYYSRMKRFKDEAGRISYITAILKNNIKPEADALKRKKLAEREINKKTFEADDINIGTNTTKAKDVSNLLGGMD